MNVNLEQMIEEPQFVLNRVVAVVLPKAPLVELINRACPHVHGPVSLDAARADPNAFLIPAHPDEFDAPGERWLQANWAILFERILRDWSEDEKRWPAMRTKAMFDQWCEVRSYSVVFDCTAQALQYSDA